MSKTKRHKYCYHITNGITRSAIISGTITASSMEEAAVLAAKRAKLTPMVVNIGGQDFTVWSSEGKKRSLYVLHDPKPLKP